MTQAHRISKPVCSAFLQGGDQVLRCILGLPQSSQGFSRVPKCRPAQVPWHILRLSKEALPSATSSLHSSAALTRTWLHLVLSHNR